MAELPALIEWVKKTLYGSVPFPYWLDKKGGTYRFHGDRIEVIKPYSKVIYFDASKRSASDKSGSELARILDELKTRGMNVYDTDQLLKSVREGSTEELYDYLRESRKAKADAGKKAKKAATTTAVAATTSTFVPSTYSTYTPTPAATTTAPAPVAKKKKAKRKAPTPFFKKPWFPFAVGGVALLLFLGVGLAVRSGRRGQAALPAPAPTKVMA